MSSRDCLLIGRVNFARKNVDGTWNILVEELSGATTENKWYALPKQYELKLPNPTDSTNFHISNFRGLMSNPSYQVWGKEEKIGDLVAFIITVNFNWNNGNISGFKIDSVISLDLDLDISSFLKNIEKEGKANATSLPLYQYLKYREEESYSDGNYFKFNENRFEMAFIDDSIFSKEILPEKLTELNEGSESGEIGFTLVNLLKKEKFDFLTLENIGLIFDKFYRPIRGLGFHFEYTYGESVTYKISVTGDIVHCFKEDKISSREDTSEDISRRIETVVIRLGDRLTDEMIEFLKEPVKGHYSPNVLFKE